jgi:hypothetical protein
LMPSHVPLRIPSLLSVAHGKAFAAPAPPAFQHIPAAARAHALPKAVGVRSLAPGGLERSLHAGNPLCGNTEKCISPAGCVNTPPDRPVSTTLALPPDPALFRFRRPPASGLFCRPFGDVF